MFGKRIHRWALMLLSTTVLTLLPAAQAESIAELDEEIVTHRCECAAHRQVHTLSRHRRTGWQARLMNLCDGDVVQSSISRFNIGGPVSHADRYALNGIGAPLRC